MSVRAPATLKTCRGKQHCLTTSVRCRRPRVTNHFPVLHDEIYLPQRDNVLQRIRRCRNDVSGKSRANFASGLSQSHQISDVHGHAFQDECRWKTCFLPDFRLLQNLVRPRAVGEIESGVGAESHLDAVPVGPLQPLQATFAYVFASMPISPNSIIAFWAGISVATRYVPFCFIRSSSA